MNQKPPAAPATGRGSVLRLTALSALLSVSGLLLGACSSEQTAVIAEDVVALPATPRLSSMENFRDLAGADAASAYRNAEGRVLKRGVFYRSNAITPGDEDWATLNGLGISAVYDLRTPGEIAKAPDRVPEGAQYVHINLFGSDNADPPALASAAEAERMMEDAERMLVTNAAIRERLAQLLTRMAEGEGAQVFHCTAGKDRTGWVAALLHSIAGVSEEVIFKDYLLTNTYTKTWMDTTRQHILEERGQAFADAYAPLLGVQESFLRAGFEQVQESYGSMDRYLAEGLGLDERVLARLREKLLE